MTCENRPVSYTHRRAHETGRNIVSRILLEQKNQKRQNLEKQKQIFELTPYYTSGQYTDDLLNVEAFSTRNPKLGKKYQDRINAKVGYAITTYIRNNSHLIPEIKTDLPSYKSVYNTYKELVQRLDSNMYVKETVE